MFSVSPALTTYTVAAPTGAAAAFSPDWATIGTASCVVASCVTSAVGCAAPRVSGDGVAPDMITAEFSDGVVRGRSEAAICVRLIASPVPVATMRFPLTAATTSSIAGPFAGWIVQCMAPSPPGSSHGSSNVIWLPVPSAAISCRRLSTAASSDAAPPLVTVTSILLPPSGTPWPPGSCGSQDMNVML